METIIQEIAQKISKSYEKELTNLVFEVEIYLNSIWRSKIQKNMLPKQKNKGMPLSIR